MAENKHVGSSQSSSSLSVSSLSSIGSGSSSTHVSSLQSSGVVAAHSIMMKRVADQDKKDSKTDSKDVIKRKFAELIASASDTYGSMLPSPLKYEFKLVHGKQRPHWFFLLKIVDSTLPYITMEINTADMEDLVPTVRNGTEDEVSEVCDEANSIVTDLDAYEGRLQDLCEIADGIVEGMRGYNLVSSNCQHFCNNLLRKLGRKPFSTTVGHQYTHCNDKK